MKNIIALVAATVLIASCSSKDKETQSSAGTSAAGNLSITTAFTPEPPRKGDDILTVTLKDGTGIPVKNATVKIDTAMPSMSMPGPSVTAHDNGDGSYSARLALQYATRWQFTVSAKANGKTSAVRTTADVK